MPSKYTANITGWWRLKCKMSRPDDSRERRRVQCSAKSGEPRSAAQRNARFLLAFARLFKSFKGQLSALRAIGTKEITANSRQFRRGRAICWLRYTGSAPLRANPMSKCGARRWWWLWDGCVPGHIRQMPLPAMRKCSGRARWKNWRVRCIEQTILVEQRGIGRNASGYRTNSATQR